MTLYIVLSCDLLPLKAFASHLFAIETMIGSNYKKLRRNIGLAFGLMNLDICLLEAKPSVYDDLLLRAKFNKCERSNRLSLMVIYGQFLKQFLVRFHRLKMQRFLEAIGQKFNG